MISFDFLTRECFARYVHELLDRRKIIVTNNGCTVTELLLKARPYPCIRGGRSSATISFLLFEVSSSRIRSFQLAEACINGASSNVGN